MQADALKSGFIKSGQGSGVKVLYLYGGLRAELYKDYQHGRAPANAFWGLTHMGSDGIEASAFFPEAHPGWRRIEPNLRKNFGIHFAHLPVVPRMSSYDVVFSTAGLDLPLIKYLLKQDRPRWVWMNFSLISTLTGHSGMKGRLIRRLVQSMDALVCLTTFERDYFINNCGIPKEKVFFVPLGVDSDFLKPEKTKPGDYVLAIGNDRGRDYKTYFEAISGTKLPAVAFCKPYNVKGLSVPPEIKVEHEPKGAWGSYYFNSRFVVVPLKNPSRLEGSDCSGLTCILDAMALGKAVIVSDVPTISDYIDHGVTGLHVPPEDPKALREAIQKLWNDPAEAERLGKNARKAVETRFSSSHFAKTLGEVFKTVHSR